MRDGQRPAREGRRPARVAVPLVVPAKIRVPSPDALPRERLEARLADAWRHRLTLVVAPAGSGKTTLVARFAARATVPVGWYRAETWDADEPSFVRHLEAALRSALPDLPGGWTSVEDVAKALESNPAPAAALVIDDGHALEGTAAEAALGRLVDYAPPWLAVVVACRVPPSINLPRLRVSGELLELGPDDLRFRAWEVEQLFRDVYKRPGAAGRPRRAGPSDRGLGRRPPAVPPRDARPLGRRAPAGAQRGRDRAGASCASTSPRTCCSACARTCASSWSTPACWAGCRGRCAIACAGRRAAGSCSTSWRAAACSPCRWRTTTRRFRYHEVLRQHLDRMLVEGYGEAEARARHARAGEVLEADGALPEALRAYCRAEDWDAVRRLLGGQGERLAATEQSAWVDAVPPAIERHDPWVALAAARRARNDGRWSAAIDGYVRAETAFGPSRAADAPRRERQRIAAWLDPVAMPTPDAVGALRTGLVREPVVGARDAARLDDPAAPVARGLLLLAAGEVVTAQRLLGATADAGEAGVVACAAARLGSVWPRALPVSRGTRAPWTGRSRRPNAPGHRGSRGSGGRSRCASRHTLDRARPSHEPATDDATQDPWGRALLDLATAWAATSDPEGRLAAADAATGDFRRLGAGVLEAWARGLAALAAASLGTPDARDAALGAESAGRAAGSQPARMYAYAALADVDEVRGTEYALLAASVAADTGLVVPRAGSVVDEADGRDIVGVMAADAQTNGNGHAASNGHAGTGTNGLHAPTNGAAIDAPTVRIRTLGGFALDVDGGRVLLDGAKPRVRSLLRLLAVHAGVAVHREVIQEALWSDADATAGARSLHVALSALRRWLDEVAAPVGGALIAREGDAYRLDVAPEAFDLGRFDRALAEGRAARARGELASAAFALALELYGGELVPEEGPAEWIVPRRDHYREAAVEAAGELASESMLAGDFATAVRACRFGLEIDRYQDSLWRMLIEARDRAGDTGAASRDRREYAAILEGLGVGGAISAAAGPA